jgi:FixJ family two-component response regulator
MQRSAAADPIVYVVDDDADVRDGMMALFESVALRCETFGSATQFLSRKAEEVVSCLVLDVRLPELSGFDLQARLAEAQNNIPGIFLTGFGDIPMTVKALKAGAVEFLTKPVREQDLLDAVRDALQRDRLRRQREEELRDLRALFDALTPREREVMSLLTGGFMNKQAAAEFGVSESTLKVHRHNIMRKLGIRSITDLVRIAHVLGVRSKKPPRR